MGGNMMNSPFLRRSLYAALAVVLFSWFGQVRAADPDPKALKYILKDKLPWADSATGQKQVILFGDPSKPGMYGVLTKWLPGNMSRPHSHPNDRYIMVLSGTWWVGTGSTYDPASTFPIPAGSFVTHFANEMHYDGAKDQEVVLEIVGMGPANAPGRAK